MMKLKTTASAFTALLFATCIQANETEERTVAQSDIQSLATSAILAEGTFPAGMPGGSKKIMVIESQDELANLWGNYTQDAMPEVDFTSHKVLLVDQGMYPNPCSDMHLQSVDQLPIAKGFSKITLNQQLDKLCPGQFCIQVVSQPYSLISIKTQDRLVFSEKVTTSSCENRPTLF